MPLFSDLEDKLFVTLLIVFFFVANTYSQPKVLQTQKAN